MRGSQKGRIVVGFDGSKESCAAVEWAAREAEQGGLALTLLHVDDRPKVVAGLLPARRTAALAEGVLRARSSAPTIDVTSLTRRGSTAEVLISGSVEAELLVIGTRGHGDGAGTLLGSVAFAVPGRSRIPVVVVRGQSSRHPGPGRPVVVGIDGSEAGEGAARYGGLMAARTGAPLILVTAYPLSSPGSYFSAESSSRESFDTLVRQDAERVTSGAAESVRARHAGLDVRVRVVEGPAAWVLTEAAREAALLVVGSRGLTGLDGLLLGSVSHSAVHSSPCPVAILPA